MGIAPESRPVQASQKGQARKIDERSVITKIMVQFKHQIQSLTDRNNARMEEMRAMPETRS